MGLVVTANDVKAISDDVWLVNMQPHEVRMFGEPRQSVGARSVLLLTKHTFNGSARTLSFDVDNATALNIGTQASVVVIGAADALVSKNITSDGLSTAFGPGDREFLRLAEELPPDMQKAAEQLLTGVRARWAGDLKRGLKRNFSNTPDNFWYVVIQPRVGELSVTVRGKPSDLGDLSGLELKDDRPGYSRFKITSPADVEPALGVIGASRRKH